MQWRMPRCVQMSLELPLRASGGDPGKNQFGGEDTEGTRTLMVRDNNVAASRECMPAARSSMHACAGLSCVLLAQVALLLFLRMSVTELDEKAAQHTDALKMLR